MFIFELVMFTFFCGGTAASIGGFCNFSNFCVMSCFKVCNSKSRSSKLGWIGSDWIGLGWTGPVMLIGSSREGVLLSGSILSFLFFTQVTIYLQAKKPINTITMKHKLEKPIHKAIKVCDSLVV